MRRSCQCAPQITPTQLKRNVDKCLGNYRKLLKEKRDICLQPPDRSVALDISVSKQSKRDSSQERLIYNTYTRYTTNERNLLVMPVFIKLRKNHVLLHYRTGTNFKVYGSTQLVYGHLSRYIEEHIILLCLFVWFLNLLANN